MTMHLNDYQAALLEAKKILGSFKAVGGVCGDISGESVRKWFVSGRPPRTDYTGETRYAELIERATAGAVTARELRPDLAAIFALEPHTKSAKAEEAA